ncbi:ABC-three component system middle component 5 [Sphingomonas sp. CJ20]
MISYQPALDRYHTIFRLMALVRELSTCLPIEVDKLRLLDFFLAFPFRLETFSFKKAHASLKKVGKSYRLTQPYGGIPDDATLFLRMAPVQALALDTLAAHALIDPDAYQRGVIMAGDAKTPDALSEAIATYISDNAALFEAIRTLACDYALLGSDGLKRRSGLMEYKYDAA